MASEPTNFQKQLDTARREAQARWTPEKRAALREKFAKEGHPRTGTRHSEEAKQRIREAARTNWARRQATFKPRDEARERLAVLERVRRYTPGPELEAKIAEAREQVAALDELL